MARGDPSYARGSDLFMRPSSCAALRKTGTLFWGSSFAVFWPPLLANPPPPPANSFLGHTPAGTFRKKFRKNSGKTPETLSERFLEFPSRVRLASPKRYTSRHLRLPDHFQNSLPPSTAGDASFFRSGSGEGLSEPAMEFPAVLGIFLTFRNL